MRQRHRTCSYNRVAPLALLALAAIFSMGAKRCEHTKGCFQDGKHFEAGESFPSSDGCNTCRCDAGGAIACTLRACLPPDGCGGGAACAEDEYCSPPADAACDTLAGACEPKPEICTAIYDPVCGCDGETYGNDCQAASQGIAVASKGECEGSASTCQLGDTEFEVGESVICDDGCNQCTCEGDDRWISTLIYCEREPIERCDDADAPTEGLTVTPLYRNGDALALSVQYGGGCFPHTFKLCYSGAFLESSPVQTPIWVVDTTEEVDICLALPTEQRVWDLAPLRELYTEQYPDGPNTLLLNLGRSQIEFTF